METLYNIIIKESSIETIYLVIKFKEMLTKIKYDDLKKIMELDYELFKKKIFAENLLNNLCGYNDDVYLTGKVGIDLDSDIPYLLYQESKIQTNIKNEEDAKNKFLALEIANDTKNTTLD